MKIIATIDEQMEYQKTPKGTDVIIHLTSILSVEDFNELTKKTDNDTIILEVE